MLRCFVYYVATALLCMALFTTRPNQRSWNHLSRGKGLGVRGVDYQAEDAHRDCLR